MAGIFSRFIFNNAIFNTDGGTPTPPDTHDGADPDSYKRYRKRLERLARLSDEHLKSKYVKEAVKVAEFAQEIPISVPIIQEVSERVSVNQRIDDIDLSALQREIARLLIYIEKYINELEQEDELILLMCV